MEQQINELTINGQQYVLKSSIQPEPPKGNRCVLVIDRGWVVAGDIEDKDWRIFVTRALWLFKWNEIGLDGVIKSPKSPKAVVREWPGGKVDVPAGAEVFRIPVSENWGL